MSEPTAAYTCPRGHRHYEGSAYCTRCGAGPVLLLGRIARLRASLSGWWREDRPVYWIHGRWEWGWLGNGWNRLALGKVAVYFKSGVSPLARSFGWLHDD